MPGMKRYGLKSSSLAAVLATVSDRCVEISSAVELRKGFPFEIPLIRSLFDS